MKANGGCAPPPTIPCGGTTDIQATGAITVWAVVEALNRRGMKTARGGEWHGSKVLPLVARTK